MKSLTATRKQSKTLIGLLVLFALAIFALPADTHAATTLAELQEILKANYPDGLPQSLTPEEQQWMLENPESQQIKTLAEGIVPLTAPTDPVRTPAEYEPVYATMIAWEPASAAQQAILTDYIVGVTTDPNMNSVVYIGVLDAAQQATCTTALTTHSPAADMDRVRFYYYNFDALWICDFGPRSIIQNGNTSAVIDHKYNRTRPLDDAFPAWSVANHMPWASEVPLYNWGGTTDATSMIHGGGNWLNFSDGNGFSSRLIVDENPTRTEAAIIQSFKDYFDVNETLFPRLLTTMDSTSHIDMWFMPIGNKKVVISTFTTAYPDSKSKTDAAAATMAARGYTVYRTPAWSSTGNETGSGTHFTYTNIAIVNKKVFVPTYAHANDAGALATYASALPGYTIVSLDCSGTISLAGAIHCIIKHVYNPVNPYAEVLKPNGGETFVVGQQKQIKWIANDDVSVASVDLDYSTNGGTSWNTIATGESHDGNYMWTVPAVDSTQCLVRVVVHDNLGNTYTDNSNANFTITATPSVEFVAAGTAQSGTAAITVPWPTHQAGDVALLFVESAGGQAATLSTPAGFAAVANSPQSTGTGTAGTRITVFWCRATSSSMSSPVVADPGDHVYGRILTFRNVISTGDPWDVTAGGIKATASTTTTFGTVTTSVNNDLIVLAAARDNDATTAAWSSWTNANLSGLTEQSDGGTTSGGGGGIGVATGLKAVAGAIGSSTATVTSSVDGHMTIALKPQISGPVTRTLTVSTTTGGTVTTPGIGNFNYSNGTNASIVAANDVNYHFVNWTGSAVTAGKVANPNAASTTVLMDANYTVQANFVVNTRSLTTSTTAGGTVSTPGIGTYWYNQGTTNPIIASANTGYHFVNWTGSAVTAGKVANTTAASTTVLVDANYAVQSNFGINQYSITGTAGANGSINPSGTFSKDYGTSQLFTASPSGGYGVDTWYVDGSPVQTGGLTYTLTNITATHTVNVTFKIQTFSITGTAGANGSINPSGTFSKDYGSNQLFTASPSGGYSVDTWYVDGSPVQTGGLTYTLTNITATHTVNVTFKIQTFTLAYTAGANGSIVGTTPQTVDYGTSGTAVTAQPALGYHFVSWSDSSTQNPRTDLNVTASISVTATFTQDEYTLTINTVGSGSVAKSPDQATYHYGDVVTLNPTADAGWTFSAFTGDTTTGTITMNGNKTVTATFTQDEYTLTINTVGSGSVAKSPDQATYHYGDVVTLNPTADAGWTFSAFTGDTTTGTITMNGNKTVTATFTQDEYTLTINTVGSGSVAKSPDQATYHYGDVVTLNPTADAGWTFSAFTGDTTTGTITMNGNKTVTATFTQDEYTLTINTVGSGSVAKSPDQATYHYGDVVTLNPTADAGWTFSAFTGDTTTGTITMNGNKTVTATFTQDEYTLTINTVGSGSVAKSPDQATYHYGDVVTLNPTADAGWTFSAFTGDTTTGTITMNGNKTVTATFTQDEYTLTINTVGSGSVAKSPDQATYHYGDVVTLNPTADAGWTFSAFTGDTTTGTITMNGNKTVTATFTQDEYTLTINTVGSGSVAKSPDQATYHYGDVVTLNPTADAGWTFSAFTGDTTTGTITMNGNKTVTATFTQDEYTLTINTVGSGSVAKSPDQATYHYGDVVTLNPTADAGWTFSAFTGDTTTGTITMNGNKTVTATFTQDEYTLTINTVGSGSVAKSPDQATYHYGDVVTLNPTADAGWTFSAFTGDTTTGTITMNGNKTVTATFTQDEYTLTINTVGSGSVAKSPDQATYHYGDVVTLNPTADAGWTFSAFTGDTTTGTITMNGNKTVTATFTQDEYTLTINTVGSGSVAKSPDQATYHYGDVVTLNPTADAGWTFSAFTGDTTTGTITMNGNKTVTATFTQDEYTLTINTVGSGSVAKSPDQATYHYGDVVTLNPTADAGWTFSAFTGDTTTGTITMNGNKTVTATFTQDEYTLTINTVGSGSVAKSPDQATYHYGDVVTLNPTADAGWTFSAFTGDTTTGTITMNGNKTVTATFTQDEYTLTINTVGSGSVAKSPDQATYHYGDVVTLNPTADAGWTFSAFTGDTTTGTITMNGNKTVTATFTQDEYTLTINTVGSGSVAKSPDQATYHYGDVVTLNPTADAGWTFSAFTGDTTTGTITMNGNKTVTATFTQDEYTLTINTVGSGSVAKSPDQATYHYGDVVTLNPTADAGWTFSAFTGDTTTGTITMNGNKTVTATFTQDEYTLTINTVGSGSVAKSPDQATYHYGDVVTLNPTADAGWTFSAFTGDTTTGTITMNGNKTVTATFTQDEYTLTINTVGSGSVAKSPDQATYHYGDVVTLNPTADAGWTFSAFTGDTTTGTITMNGNKTVTATFTQDEYTLTINTVGSGSVAKSPDQATYHYGDVVTLNPTADAGWTFSAFTGDTTTGTITMNGNKTVTATFTQDEYTLTINTVGSGSVAKSPDQATYHYGDVVTLNPTADAGWTFSAFTGDTTTGTITMNGNKTVTATFTQDEYTLTINTVGSGSVAKSPDQATYHYGDVVTLNPTADAGWTFSAFTGDTTTGTITMNGNKTVTATFTQDEYTLTINTVGSGSVAKSPDQATYHYGDVVTLNPTADAGWTFSAFTGDTTTGTITMNGNKTVTATFTQDEYTLTINTVGSGSVAKSPDQATYHYGDVVTLNPTADAGWTFSAFTGDTTTGTITMNGNKTVTATFTQDEYTLTINTVGSGSVAKSPDQATYHYGDVVTLNPTADAGWTFSAFTGDTTTGTITMNGNKTVTATFTQDEYTLTINTVGSGSVAKSPDQATYHYGDVVTLNPTADAGWTFSAFTGDTTTGTITMNGNKTVTATFTQDEYTLTINTVGSGSVAKSPDQATYHYGDVVTLNPTADAGWTFSAFTGDTTTGTITMNGNKTVTATFTIDTFTLEYTAGANGSISGTTPQTVDYGTSGTAVTAQPALGYHFVSWSDSSTQNPRTDAGVTANISVTATFAIDTFTLTASAGANGSIDPVGAVLVNYGDDQTFTAIPDSGYEVTEWFVDGESVQIGGTTYTLTGVIAAHTVHVQFTGSQYEISGTITCAGLPVANVTMGGLGVITDVNGFYYTTVAYGWSGVVMPAKDGYTFDPNNRSYTVVADQVGQNYRALPADNFNDNRRGSMWRRIADGSKVWQIEDANRLNIGASGWFNLLTSCTGHWRMNDNAASTTVLDASGNNRNGTAQQNTGVLHTTGKIDGALTFNGTSDYVDIGNVIGTGAYTKVAWVKRDAGNYYNNIVSSGNNLTHAIYAPYTRQFRLCAGHVNPYDVVKDTVPMDVGVWYQVAVTFDPNVSAGKMVLYKNGAEVNEATGVPTQGASTNTYIGKFATSYNMKGAIDNVMIFNRALTAAEIAALYDGGNGTEILIDSSQQASYSANGWKLDTAEDLAVKMDFHYSDVSTAEGWIGLSVGDDANYVSISCGSDGGQSYFYYRAVVDGSTVSEREPRISDEGVLYVSYNAASKDFYVSHSGFGSENAYTWSVPNATRGQWPVPVYASIGGGGTPETAIDVGEAYMDNFETAKGGLLGWPVVTDIDSNGYIEIYDLAIMCENWLDSGQGDIDNSGVVDFLDFAEFGLAW